MRKADQKKALRLASQALASLPQDKKSPPDCRLFRTRCFLFHPQPPCEGCQYKGAGAIRPRPKEVR